MRLDSTTTTRAAGRRGSTGLLVVAGVAATALIAFLAVDIDALKRGWERDALLERVGAYTEARSNEDAATLVAMLVPGEDAVFDAAHMERRWAFDRSDVLSMDEPEVDIRWESSRATITRTVRVQVDLEPEATSAHPFAVAGPAAEPAAVSEEQEHVLEQTWFKVGGQWVLTPGDEPWGRSRIEALYAERIDDLEVAFERFAEAKVRDDHQQVYAMLSAESQERHSLGVFLQIYGQGVLKFHRLNLLGVEVLDDSCETALLSIEQETELIPENATPEIRAAAANADPALLRGVMQLDMTWHFEDGEWRAHLEDQPENSTPIVLEDR